MATELPLPVDMTVEVWQKKNIHFHGNRWGDESDRTNIEVDWMDEGFSKKKTTWFLYEQKAMIFVKTFSTFSFYAFMIIDLWLTPSIQILQEQ